MRLLNFLAQAFIGAFGITQPSTPRQQRLVSLILGGFLLTILLVVVSITGFLLYEFHGGR